MKKYMLFTWILLVTTYIYSQQNYDERLLARYTTSQLQKMAKETPGHLEWLNYKVANMYKIIDRNTIKGIVKDTLKGIDMKTKKPYHISIKDINLDNFNPLRYNIAFDKQQHYYYIPQSNKVVYIRPSVEVIKEFNKKYRK